MRPNVNIQICFYPYFNGGFYLSGSFFKPMNRMMRLSLGFIDFRLWFDITEGGLVKQGPRIVE